VTDNQEGAKGSASTTITVRAGASATELNIEMGEISFSSN